MFCVPESEYRVKRMVLSAPTTLTCRKGHELQRRASGRAGERAGGA
jgi:hypothetical protein